MTTRCHTGSNAPEGLIHEDELKYNIPIAVMNVLQIVALYAGALQGLCIDPRVVM